MWLFGKEERRPGFHKSIFQVSTWDLTFDRRQLTKITQQSRSRCGPTPTIWAPVSLAWHSKSEPYKVSFWKTVFLSGCHGPSAFSFSQHSIPGGNFGFLGASCLSAKKGGGKCLFRIFLSLLAWLHIEQLFCWAPLLLHSEFYLSTVFIVKENPFFLTMGKANSHVDLGGCQVLWAIKGQTS